ncbi:acetyl-CoA carboxylase biotin carboxyl carrier protein [Leptolyngbya sp. AN02str]|uniref:acetyl-CoA carboxylase biotin carboxyl carrier protein n=1 Tax=Leptolyngbya sp. AN02str TaxID=3423363 RepID=UPI003D32245A
MELNLDELRELLSAVSQADISEITLKSGDFELTVRKGPKPGEYVLPQQTSVVEMPAPAIAALPAPTAPAPAAPALSAPPPSSANDKLVEITSPMVGTFYRAPAPDEPPFVDVGDRVRSGQTVCIIEAMKLMNEIEAEVNGEIVELLVQNGQPVEFGQVLMRVNPT